MLITPLSQSHFIKWSQNASQKYSEWLTVRKDSDSATAVNFSFQLSKSKSAFKVCIRITFKTGVCCNLFCPLKNKVQFMLLPAAIYHSPSPSGIFSLGRAGIPKAIPTRLLLHSLCPSPHSRGSVIGTQWCAKMRSSWAKCNLNRWLSCGAKLKSLEPNWSPLKLVASEWPEEISQNVYKMDLSVVNWVASHGKAALPWISIGCSQNFNHNIPRQKDNWKLEDHHSFTVVS